MENTGRVFESDVVPDSGKTKSRMISLRLMFESDVVPDSGKTRPCECLPDLRFESDVVPDSGKTADDIMRAVA